MTRDEIIRMAREAGIGVEPTEIMLPYLEAFAAIVAEAAHKDCANICVSMAARPELGLEIQDRMLLAAAKRMLLLSGAPKPAEAPTN